MVEQLARQHSHLEQAAQQQQHKPQQGGASLLAHSIHSEEDEDNEFFDAEEDEIKADFIVQVPIGHRRTPSANSQASEGRNAGENTQDSESDAEDTTISVITRRNTSTVVTNKTNICPYHFVFSYQFSFFGSKGNAQSVRGRHYERWW
jgi:hypothetical protein